MLNIEYVNDLIRTRVHVETVDSDDIFNIVNNYIKPARPVKIKGVGKNWNTHSWTLDYFNKRMGDFQFPVNRRNIESGFIESKEVKLADFTDYMREQEIVEDLSPFYLNTTLGPTEEMLSDYCVPDYLRCSFNNFRGRLDQNPFSWIYLAPKYSATALHVDVIHSSAWNMVITGKKFWVFFPEEQSRYLYGGQVNPFAPDVDKHRLYRRASPMVCIQQPGETVFTPSGWYHAVLNLEMGVSLTENFVNRYNAERVKAYCDAVGIPITGLNALLDEVVVEDITW